MNQPWRRVLASTIIMSLLCLNGAIKVAHADETDPSRLFESRDSWRIDPGPWLPDLSTNSSGRDVIPAVAEQIYKRGDAEGLYTIHSDYDNRALTVLWKKGQIPADVAAFAVTRPYGVAIHFVETKYSKAELRTARNKILGGKLQADLGLLTTDLNDDGSGFTIGIAGNEPLTEPQMQQLRDLAGIDDIEIKVGTPEPRVYANRTDDTSPWSGGARIWAAYGGCTTGFTGLVGGVRLEVG